MFFVQVVATLFLLAMSAYLFPPFIESFRARPPRIINLTYSAITCFSLVIGFKVVFYAALIGTLRGLLTSIYTPDALGSHLSFTIATTILATSFVVGGMVRTYFNLHNIESNQSAHPLARAIGGLAKSAARVETALRIAMICSILFIELHITYLRNEFTPTSLKQFALSEFSKSFSFLWLSLAAFYVILIGWDILVATRTSSEDITAARKLILRQGLPVHVTGLFVSFPMFLVYGHFYSGTADLIFPISGLSSIVGIAFLTWSLKRDNLFQAFFGAAKQTLKLTNQES